MSYITWYNMTELLSTGTHGFPYVPHVVHQQHRAVWHHGKVGGVEVW